MRSIKLPSWTSRLLGLDAVQVPPHIFAVGEDELRYTGFLRGTAGLELAEYRTAPLAAELWSPGALGGPLREAGAFRAEVAKLVGQLAAPVAEASLVLPDAWLRLTFVELDEVPKEREARDEILRWKLKRLVPFRVEELRIQGLELPPLPGSTAARRFVVGFALDTLVGQLESAFDASGVRVGLVTSESLALLSALDAPLAEAEMGALVWVQDASYTLVFTHRGAPILHRFKPLNLDIRDPSTPSIVGRDLRLTRSYLEELLPEPPLDVCLLCAPRAVQSIWSDVLGEGLGVEVTVVDAAQLPLAEAPGVVDWDLLMPLVGAASREVG